MSHGSLYIVLVVALMMGSCASNSISPTSPTYTERLEQRPLPATEADIVQECNWIRSEIARMQSLGAQAVTAQHPQYILAFQAIARNNIAALESRAANIRCAAAFSSPPATGGGKPTIQQCIEACKANTSRTPAQCFDACNR